jgi:hypothetical protein
VLKNNQIGFIDESFGLLLAPQYKNIVPVKNTMNYHFIVQNYNGNYAIMNDKNGFVIPFENQFIYDKKYSVELFPSQKIYEEFSDFFDKPAQYKVGVFCGSCSNIGLIAKQIMINSKCDFVIMWTLNLETKEYVLTFRSNYVNVEDIAYTLFKGGGHKLAASCGMSISKYNITDLFFPESLPRR